jgi:hypothetical protein
MKVLPGCETAYPSKRRPVVPVVAETVSWTGLGRLYGSGIARPHPGELDNAAKDQV